MTPGAVAVVSRDQVRSMALVHAPGFPDAEMGGLIVAVGPGVIRVAARAVLA